MVQGWLHWHQTANFSGSAREGTGVRRIVVNAAHPCVLKMSERSSALQHFVAHTFSSTVCESWAVCTDMAFLVIKNSASFLIIESCSFALLTIF